MRLFKKLRKKLDYLDAYSVEKIHEAFLLALDAHKGQKRLTGEPYITHPVAVACLLADMKMDAQTIMAAILHDVIEDTSIEKTTISQQFGDKVANLVDGVSKLTQIEFVTRAQAQAENFRKMVMAMARDIRVIIVKLADRLHNMRTLGSLPPLKRRRIAKETLEIFAPIAKRLGMREVSVELEELGFSALYPMRYRILSEGVRRARGNQKKMLALIEKTLSEGLAKKNLASWTLSGREKHFYSIYRKMRHKHIPFSEIMDVYAFRIIVDDIDSCYRVLGIVHNLFKPVPERFKDYIAIPKANGYQSLHTTLFGPYGLPIEMQIRTTEMDRTATNGVAAHWIYKSADDRTHQSQIRAQEWVKNLLELQQRSGNSLEFIESVKVDLFPDEVYVFTPKGDIMELPAGATAIDFAYAVHTDIGNHCVATKIDRQLAPLSSVLMNGQTVEVVVSNNSRPNPAWLDFVVTSKARSGIRHFLKSQKRSESISLGSQLLKKALLIFGLTLKKIPRVLIDRLLNEIKLRSLDDLLEEIGLGNRVADLVAQRINVFFEASPNEIKSESLPLKKTEPLIIRGTEGMVINFAHCCYPIPGDPILGRMEIGKGIMIHNAACRYIIKGHHFHAQAGMSLRWADEVVGEFITLISLEVINERGVLAVIALAISDADANIEDIDVHDKDGRHYLVSFKLLVHSRIHLAQVIRRLRQLRQVIKIMRRI